MNRWRVTLALACIACGSPAIAPRLDEPRAPPPAPTESVAPIAADADGAPALRDRIGLPCPLGPADVGSTDDALLARAQELVAQGDLDGAATALRAALEQDLPRAVERLTSSEAFEPVRQWAQGASLVAHAEEVRRAYERAIAEGLPARCGSGTTWRLGVYLADTQRIVPLSTDAGDSAYVLDAAHRRWAYVEVAPWTSGERHPRWRFFHAGIVPYWLDVPEGVVYGYPSSPERVEDPDGALRAVALSDDRVAFRPHPSGWVSIVDGHLAPVDASFTPTPRDDERLPDGLAWSGDALTVPGRADPIHLGAGHEGALAHSFAIRSDGGVVVVASERLDDQPTSIGLRQAVRLRSSVVDRVDVATGTVTRLFDVGLPAFVVAHRGDLYVSIGPGARPGSVPSVVRFPGFAIEASVEIPGLRLVPTVGPSASEPSAPGPAFERLASAVAEASAASTSRDPCRATDTPATVDAAAILWRRTIEGSTGELVGTSDGVFAHCVDGRYARVPMRESDEGAGPPVPLTTTHTARGLAWPDLDQPVTIGHELAAWRTTLRWGYVDDGHGRYERLPPDASRCTHVARAPEQVAALDLPLTAGQWVDARATLENETFRLSLPRTGASALSAVGIESPGESASLIVLEPDGDGHCVLGTWSFDFGGDGVALATPSDTAIEIDGHTVHLLVLASTARFHGHGRFGGEQTRWDVLAVAWDRVVVAARSDPQAEQAIAPRIERDGSRVVLVPAGGEPGTRLALDASTLTFR